MTPSNPAHALGLSPSTFSLILLIVMIVGEFLLFALPAVLWAVIGRQRLSEALAWRRASPSVVIGASLLGLGMTPWVQAMVVIQHHFFPHDDANMRGQIEMFLPMMQHQAWLIVVGLPLAAAVSEEMLFRGPLQRALLRRLPAWAALSLGGVIFAAAHLDLQGFLARTVLGVMLGWIVLRGRSLFPAILAHFLYDSAIFAAGVWQVRTLGAERVLAMSTDPMMGMTWQGLLGGIAVGTLMVAAGVWLCRRGRPGGSADSPLPADAQSADEVVVAGSA